MLRPMSRSFLQSAYVRHATPPLVTLMISSRSSAESSDLLACAASASATAQSYAYGANVIGEPGANAANSVAKSVVALDGTVATDVPRMPAVESGRVGSTL